jgi:TonB-dependent SusC/RagA subfamily outer membrane receptor
MWELTGSCRVAVRALVVLALVGVAGCQRGAAPESPRPTAPRPVDAIAGERLQRVEVRRVEELLQGRFAGVRVTPMANGEFSVRIRGASSFYGSTEPLFVVDGMPVEKATLLGIHPTEVERIEVIKDGQAAQYGVRGANGVILITTRRPG